LDFLQNIDARLFQWVNGSYHSEALDRVMMAISSHYFAAVISIVIAAWIYKKDKNNFWKNTIFIAAVVGAMDVFNSYVFKPGFERLRPCRLEDFARIVGGCASWYGFPSNHAANSMAAAAVTWSLGYVKLGKALLLMALVIGLSRIYLGVHYPLDVTAGFIVGSSWGFLAGSVMKKLGHRS
jgi:undecaprenyl-diphosphatase